MRRNVFTTYDPSLPSGKKFVAVHVQNEDPLYFLVEVKSKVCELFAQITKFLDLHEPELFGLAIKCSDSFLFLDPLEKLSKYAPKPWRTQNNGMDNDGLPLFNVYFRVQFYVDSYLFISDKIAKVLYYHQMRENVLHYNLAMCEERAFQLASFALQADFGNYNCKLHKDRYFEPKNYFPLWVIEELGIEYITRNLPALHCDHKGMSKSEAQSMFIKEASDATAPHNFHFYKLTCKKGATSSDVWLAITISGIAIYANEPINEKGLKSRISFFQWSDIGKLSFEKKKFEIRSTGSHGRKFVYYAISEEIARHLLWFSRASHQFHLMVQTKMKEMLKREAEINRRKYRESCISSTSSRNSSSGNSSGSCSANPSNNTSKSASPFDYSSGSSSAGHKKDTSDLDISNSSVCEDDSHIDQRISVISNASSNTTSGIVSEKMHGLEDSDRDDIDSDLLMGLNHHHHHNHHHAVNRAMALSGCSPNPVVSMESLALSEPIEHRTRDVGGDKMNLTSNKKHSISISNIMITASTPTSVNDSQSFDSLLSGGDQVGVKTTVVNNYAPVNEVLVTGDSRCSSGVLCLNINDRNQSTSSTSPYGKSDLDSGDDSSSMDDTDSVFDNTSKSYTSGKSNVTVLSTILKPEAERLLKQGIEAENASELLIDDGIDSLELAELKKLENAEKEKLILNSLINNIPPPTMLTSSDSDTDSEDEDDVNNNNRNGAKRQNCYSPLTQEKFKNKYHSSPKSIVTRDRNKSGSSSSNSSADSRRSSSVDPKKPAKKVSPHHFTKPANVTHIYENIHKTDSVATPKKAPTQPSQPPAVSTTPRQCPALSVFSNSPTVTPYQHRTGMRIGVSSLNRPYSAQKNKLLLHGGCVHNNNSSLPYPAGCCSNIESLSAGSEPNLYWNGNEIRNMSANKSDSVFDCRAQEQPTTTVAPPVPTSQPPSQPSYNSFKMFINKQLGSSEIELPKPDYKHSLNGQDNNNNIEKIYSNFPRHIPPSGCEEPKITSPVASHCNTKRSNGSISELHQLRQRSSDLNLPLITALFNDQTLAMSNQYRELEANKMSQSLQQIPKQVARESPSGATVERTSTFRVDEAIAKSALRHQDQQQCGRASRPISWHKDRWNCFEPNTTTTSTAIHMPKMFATDRVWPEQQLTT